MKTKTMILLPLVAVTLAALAGCGQKSETSTGNETNTPPANMSQPNSSTNMVGTNAPGST